MVHRNMTARLIELLGVLAALLACVGLYGVTAYSVARRTAEIGIRAALAAKRIQAPRTVLGAALGQVTLAVVFGIPGSWAAGRALESQLYGVKGGDWLILGSAAAALLAAALAASFLLAWRASTIDPTRALRS